MTEVARFGRKCSHGADRENNVHLEADELGCDLRAAFTASPVPAIFDCNVATFDPAKFVQPP